MTKPHLFLYAFAPSGNRNHNISQTLLNSLPDHPHLTKHTYQVRFSFQTLLKPLEGTKPTHILGLGQYPRGHRLRVETLALNKYGYKREPKKPIDSSLPASLPINWPLPPSPYTYSSTNPGTYVCNFSIFTLLNYSLENGIKYAFIHVPKNTDQLKATAYFESLITPFTSSQSLLNHM